MTLARSGEGPSVRLLVPERSLLVLKGAASVMTAVNWKSSFLMFPAFPRFVITYSCGSKLRIKRSEDTSGNMEFRSQWLDHKGVGKRGLYMPLF